MPNGPQPPAVNPGNFAQPTPTVHPGNGLLALTDILAQSLADRFQDTSEWQYVATLSVEEKKARLRKILASFERYTLPSEFMPEVYATIDEAQGERPSTEWTIPGNFMGSLLVKGTHDNYSWMAFQDIHSNARLCRLFAEKLRRRFRLALRQYDGLASATEHNQRDHVHDRVMGIANTLPLLARAAMEDPDRWSVGLLRVLGVLLKTLAHVCERLGNRAPDYKPGLYDVLIQRPQVNTPLFMLDALEVYFDLIPAAELGRVRPLVRRIDGLLVANGAPAAYQARFVMVSQRAF